MKFSNFTLESPTQAITVIGLGMEWDLHNFAVFTGLSYEAGMDSLSLEWRVPSQENPWGWPANKALGCKIEFQQVSLLRIGPATDGLLLNETDTLHGISKVVPNTEKFRFRNEWPESEPFNLLFEFGNGWAIEVAAEIAELRAIGPLA